MLELITKIICSIIFVLIEFYALKKLLNSNEQPWKIKNILLLLALVIMITLSFKPQYSVSITIITALLTIIIYKLIFNQPLFKAVVSTGIVYIIVGLADIINSTILISFFTVEQLRGSWYVMLLSNIDVAIIVLILLRIPVILKTAKKLILKSESKTQVSLLFYAILIPSVIVVLFYNISLSYNWNSNYIINLIIVTIFFVLTILFIIEKNNYDKLLDNYDILLEYVQNFENRIDEEQLKRHEYKNQLAVLNGLVKGKEAKSILKEMIQTSIEIDKKWVDQLRALPKGGIKGLIYYKMVIASNKKINLTIDVSAKVTKDLEALTETQRKVLAKLIGIYFDNAIEAAEKTTKKFVTLEIYKIDNLLKFAFTNSLTKEDISILNKQQRGLSNKGAGHGNGLYLARRLIKQNSKWIIAEKNIVDNLYVQKLIINMEQNN